MEKLEEKGIIFKDTDSALRENEELFKEYFASVVPATDNKFDIKLSSMVRWFIHLCT